MCNVTVSNLKIHKLSKRHMSKYCEFVDCQTSVEGMLKCYRYDDIKTVDVILFITEMKESIKKVFKEQPWPNSKLGISLNVLFYKLRPERVPN